MQTSVDYFNSLAAAYVLGSWEQITGHQHPMAAQLFNLLGEADYQRIIAEGLDVGMRLHRFKRTMGLPRVDRVLGIIRNIVPDNVLDIGSGRGAFLWPLLSAFPTLPVSCIDRLDYRVADINAVARGGYHHLTASVGDVTRLPFADNIFTVVLLLEVLEHVPSTGKALDEICRVANSFVIISVPSHADDNPEHIHLFTAAQLEALLAERGMVQIKTIYVPNHIIMLAKKGTHS